MKKLLFFALLAASLSDINARPVNYHLVQYQERPKLVLYYSPTCPYSQKVLNYLKAINKTVPMKNVYASPHVKEELRTLGGKMQVPCLIINGKPLYESDQIIQWLADNKNLY